MIKGMKGAELLRNLFRRIGERFKRVGAASGDQEPLNDRIIRVHFHVERDLTSTSSISQTNSPTHEQKLVSIKESQASKVSALTLEETRMLSPEKCSRLSQLGIRTAGELLGADAVKLAGHFRARKKAHRAIRRYQKAIRVASTVPNMSPRDALLLFQVYRSHSRSLAADSPAKLLRDLERYSQSTLGRRQLRGESLPSVARIKTWIDHCAKVEALAQQHDLAG